MNQPALSGAPTEPVEVPPAVLRLAAGEALVPVWRNSLGGLTFRLGSRRYVKWVPADTPEIDLAVEAERLTWASRWTPVPAVLDQGGDDDGTWLVTRAIPARSAVDGVPPPVATRAIGEGLRALHEALPVSACPFDWSVASRLDRVDQRLADGDGPAQWFAEHHHLGPAEARAILADPLPVDRLVVCHGDACAPNTLVADDGRWAGHVDLGSLGLADRWADLAVASWSTEWNYGPGWTDAVLDAYGIQADADRLAYYRLLWDLG